ncbi:MAG: helix-turn-helix transcriptional regulator [Oscillospiraceae bacterium]|nr:helix-turn-helix transcriptional regulator [Oscillospiraceae bacterium]
MADIKATIANNIASLRQAKGMTQLDLATQLNYSDKAVSKWERGESLPDISVLMEIAELFGVNLDYLVREEHPRIKEKKKKEPLAARYNRGFITGVSILLVWFLAVFAFVLASLILDEWRGQWLSFLYAVPVCLVVWLTLNSTWFDARVNYLIISLLMWSGLAAIHISLLVFCGINTWLLYLLGAPGQIIILFWSKIKRRPKKTEKTKEN